MTRFVFLDFYEFFGPQTVFIGEWGTKFIFLDFFKKLASNGQKNDQIFIKRSNSYSNDQI
jgi:hypothetical protein